MSNNDGVTEMLPELYHAGKEHRLIQERIDALAPGSKEAALMIYRMRVDAVRKAIADLRDNQLRLKLESHGVNTVELEVTLNNLLTAN